MVIFSDGSPLLKCENNSPWSHLEKDISNESVNILVYPFDCKDPPFVYKLETYIGFQIYARKFRENLEFLTKI